MNAHSFVKPKKVCKDGNMKKQHWTAFIRDSTKENLLKKNLIIITQLTRVSALKNTVK